MLRVTAGALALLLAANVTRDGRSIVGIADALACVALALVAAGAGEREARDA